MAYTTWHTRVSFLKSVLRMAAAVSIGIAFWQDDPIRGMYASALWFAGEALGLLEEIA